MNIIHLAACIMGIDRSLQRNKFIGNKNTLKQTTKHSKKHDWDSFCKCHLRIAVIHFALQNGADAFPTRNYSGGNVDTRAGQELTVVHLKPRKVKIEPQRFHFLHWCQKYLPLKHISPRECLKTTLVECCRWKRTCFPSC